MATPEHDLEENLQDIEFKTYYGEAMAKQEIAVALAKARISKGMTQVEVAEKVGHSQPYIAKLERGDANPTIGKIGSLLANLDLKLKTSVEPLIGRSGFAVTYMGVVSGAVISVANERYAVDSNSSGVVWAFSGGSTPPVVSLANDYIADYCHGYLDRIPRQTQYAGGTIA